MAGDEMEQTERLSDPAEIKRLCMEAVAEEKRKFADHPPQINSRVFADCSFSSKEIQDALQRNEDGDALIYEKLHRRRFCYDTAAGRWYIFGPHHWQRDSLNDAMRGVDDVVDVYLQELRRVSWAQEGAVRSGKLDETADLEKQRKNLLKRITALQTVFRKEHVIELARTGTDSLAINGEDWDQNPWLLAVQNGVINLHSGELRPVLPSDYIRIFAPVEYRGLKEPAPIWERFQLDICNGDTNLVSFKQRLYGYCITGQTLEHIFPIRWGHGRNGKTTEDEIMDTVLGEYAGQVESEILLSKKHGKSSGGPSPEILSLRGKRFVHCCETERGRHFNVSKIKSLTGGDSLIGRGLYKEDFISFKPTHKLFLSTNHLPHVGDDDYAFHRRIIILPYTLSFVDDPKELYERKADPNLLKKLQAEASGILAWLVRGCLEWQKQGLNPPQDIKAAKRSYRDSEDLLGHFLSECCLLDPSKTVRAGLLYRAYKKWADEMGYEPLNMMNFGLGVKRRFDSGDDYRGVFYKGIGLLEQKIS